MKSQQRNKKSPKKLPKKSPRKNGVWADYNRRRKNIENVAKVILGGGLVYTSNEIYKRMKMLNAERETMTPKERQEFDQFVSNFFHI